MGYLLVALLVAIAVAVFAMQNTTAVTVRFLAWQINELPLAAVVLMSLGAGIIVAGLPLWFQLWRTRSRLRTLTASSRPVDLPPTDPPPGGLPPTGPSRAAAPPPPPDDRF